jgi:hypothetical protein
MEKNTLTVTLSIPKIQNNTLRKRDAIDQRGCGHSEVL